ncbi:MAG: hypothetical protein K2G77_05625 [Muribaculaceae bacterium]|nr:hypothetical protein [Muribaculaceae bacterium]
MKSSHLKTLILRLLLMIVFLPTSVDARSQNFKVISFRELSNDVSAFINPVRDLNDEDCALLKIMAPDDFVFSTPLGIVKRIDKTGEIWLYLPRGSKKITVKHAEWGVLRDYEFPSKLESHKTYEITLKYPHSNPTYLTDADKIVTTVRDTLIVTRIDTLIVRPEKPKIPLETDILIGAGIGGKGSFIYGSLMAAVMKRHGGFIHISSDGAFPGQIEGICNRYGLIDGKERFYSGKTRHSIFMASAGAIHKLTHRMAIFEGLGYGRTCLDWELAPSEGGGYVRNSHLSNKGITAETGVILTYKNITVSASLITLRGTDWFGTVGIGICLGKNYKYR